MQSNDGSSQSSDVSTGEPLPIFSVNENIDMASKRIKILMKNLRRVFLDPRIANYKVMIISINGPNKTGKSFFLNICLRYLQKRRIESFTSNQDQISGFKWGPSLENTSIVIYIWSEPFIIESFLKNKIAVLFMDCQGSFNNKLLVKEKFAMHVLVQILSSLQIYNVSCQIHENNLQWLALNSDFANTCKSQVEKDFNCTSAKPYQTLCILVRDWPYPYEFFYGSAGGQQYINRYILTQYVGLPSQNISLRKFLNSQFHNVNCYLMPHFKVENPSLDNFDGTWYELSNEFQEHVLGFMKNVFSPQTLIIKEICGHAVTAKEIFVNLENYYNVATFIDNPKPQIGFEACAKSHHYLIFQQCLEHYDESMKSRQSHCKSATVLLAFHESCKMSTLQKFDDSSKLGFNKYSEKIRSKLESQIDEEFIRFYAMNPVKSVMISRLLSIIVMSIILISSIGLCRKILLNTNLRWLFKYAETFFIASIMLLIIYCLVTIKKIYNQLIINLEMQTILHN